MKKLLAVVLSSTALAVSPVVFAQASTAGGGTTGQDGNPAPDTYQPPLTPSQTETSEGATYNPPPIDHSGDPEHVTEKDVSDGGGDPGDGSGGQGIGDNGSGPGDGSDAGNGTGDGADAGTGAGNGSASGGGAGTGG